MKLEKHKTTWNVRSFDSPMWAVHESTCGSFCGSFACMRRQNLSVLLSGSHRLIWFLFLRPGRLQLGSLRSPPPPTHRPKAFLTVVSLSVRGCLPPPDLSLSMHNTCFWKHLAVFLFLVQLKLIPPHQKITTSANLNLLISGGEERSKCHYFLGA